MNKKDFKKVELPELVKFSKDMKEISGEFVSLEKSKKYADSMGLTFIVEGKKKMVFVNQVATRLFETEKVTAGDLFILEFVGMKKNLDETNEYMDFELFVKKKKE